VNQVRLNKLLSSVVLFCLLAAFIGFVEITNSLRKHNATVQAAPALQTQESSRPVLKELPFIFMREDQEVLGCALAGTMIVLSFCLVTLHRDSERQRSKIAFDERRREDASLMLLAARRGLRSDLPQPAPRHAREVGIPLDPDEYAKAKLLGPPGKTLTPAKPKWRPRSVSAVGSAASWDHEIATIPALFNFPTSTWSPLSKPTATPSDGDEPRNTDGSVPRSKSPTATPP
jgi:hypothetical protein